MTLIFIHIPKAGGRTLLDVCYRQYWTERDRIWKTKGASDGPYFRDCALDRRIDDPVIIMGHLFWGAHKYVDGPSRYFTMLRDPIRRTLSQYYHVRRNPFHCHDAALDTLSAFLDGGHTTLVDNAQTRFISGTNPPYGECDQAMLEVAKQNLSQSVVGLLEQYDRSLLHFQKSFGWKPPYYVRVNKSSYPSHLSAKDEEAILRHNRLDLGLYAFGKELFERQTEGISSSEVVSFQRLNSLHRWRFRYRRYVAKPARSAMRSTYLLSK